MGGGSGPSDAAVSFGETALPVTCCTDGVMSDAGSLSPGELRAGLYRAFNLVSSKGKDGYGPAGAGAHDVTRSSCTHNNMHGLGPRAWMCR